MPEEPFGQLNTDETKAESPYPRQAAPPTDSQQIGGCLVFTVSSLLQVGIAIAVFILLPPVSDAALIKAAWVYGIGGLLVGSIFSMFGKEPGAFGSVAGTAPAGVFTWLRLRELSLGYEGVKGMEPAGYSESIAWLFPIGYFLIGSAAWLGILAIRSRASKQ